MKTRNKIITAMLLFSGATIGTALVNQYIKMTATSKNLLNQPEPRCYRWRLGNIYYTKSGEGRPLLLIHDLHYAANGSEWNALLPYLQEHYTVYTIDLLGCGRSEKPNLTYTNFLYVQLINDFIQSEIGRRTSVITSGSSSSLVTMACGYNGDLFEQMMFINPESFLSCSQIPGKHEKYYKYILDTPILGTLLYHIAASKKMIWEHFTKEYFFNPYGVSPSYVNQYYESAHLGESPKAIYSSVACGYTKCKIGRTLEQIDHSIYILGGEQEKMIDSTIKEYTSCNPAIESSILPKTSHLPHLERPQDVLPVIQMFFG